MARHGDLFIGLVIAGIALLLLLHSFSARYTATSIAGDVSTVFFPRLLLGAMTLGGIALVVQAFRGTTMSRDTPEPAHGAIKRLIAVAVVMVATSLGMSIVGFLWAMPIGLALMGFAFGSRATVALPAVALLAPLACWWVLHNLAGVPFPTGIMN